MNSCDLIKNIIERHIFTNRLVILGSNDENIDKTISNLNKKYDLIAKTVSLEQIQNESNEYSYSILEQCVDKHFGNNMNIKQVGRNTNGFYNAKSSHRVLFPMVFINGMNIGTLENINRMIYREELNIIL